MPIINKIYKFQSYVDKDTANNDELVLDNIPKMSAFGGKGANVCIACSRLGSRNALVSKVNNWTCLCTMLNKAIAQIK
jgi:sugar/nucleoside kinase (ribokinase family)